MSWKIFSINISPCLIPSMDAAMWLQKEGRKISTQISAGTAEFISALSFYMVLINELLI